MSRGQAISSRRIGLISLVVFTAVILLSCPLPIDQQLLRLVEDKITPTISIDSPYPNSLYGATVPIEGNLRDSSFSPGDEEGLLKSLEFSVLGEPLLAMTVEFGEDGSDNVTFADPDAVPNWVYDAATGSFSFHFSTVGLSGGPLVLVFLATDFNGNESEKSMTLLEDPSGPYVELRSPENGDVYELTVAINGYATNGLTDTNTDDVKILRWEIPTEGLSGEKDLEQGTGSTNFSYDEATGYFEHWVDTAGISGDLFFVFEAFDYRNHKTQLTIQLSGNRPGPAVTIESAPSIYSSALSSNITVSGKVDATDIDWSKFTYLASGSIRGYKAEQITNCYPDPMNPFSLSYIYSFTFNPKSVGSTGIAGLMTIKVNATDSSGTRTTTVEHTVDDDPDAPAITVDSLQTNDSTPQLSGTLDENPASIVIKVASQTYSGSGVVISGSAPDLTWTCNIITPISDGTHDVDAEASDALGNTGSDGTTNELFIDTTPPSITVDALSTNDTRPEITGTINDDTATITIGVDGKQYSGSDITIGGSGPVWTWTLADNAISPALSVGTYDVSAQASDALGNTGSDGTTDELTITN